MTASKKVRFGGGVSEENGERERESLNVGNKMGSSLAGKSLVEV